MHGVHVDRHVRVDHGLVGPFEALDNNGIHLLGCDSSQRCKGGKAVENHHIDLYGWKRLRRRDKKVFFPDEAMEPPRVDDL